MSTILQDLRHGLRVLGKDRGFTVVAVANPCPRTGARPAKFTILVAAPFIPTPFSAPEQQVRGGGTFSAGVSHNPTPVTLTARRE